MDHAGHGGRCQISRRDAPRLGAGFAVAGVLPGIAFAGAPVVTRVVNTRNGPVRGLVENGVQIFKGLRCIARTENPNHAGLPHWPAYDVEKRATMTFNTPCKVVADLEAEIRKILKAQRHWGIA